MTGVEIQDVANPLELTVGEVLVVDITTAPVNLGKDGNVKFSSSNKKVFTVTEREGHIKATGAGEAVLTASVVGAPDIRSERRVVVTDKVLDVVWTTPELTIRRNILPAADVNLKNYLRVTPEEASFDVVFETQYDTIATVDEEGVFSVVGYGETDVTATVVGTSFSATIHLKITPVLVEEIIVPANWDPMDTTARTTFLQLTLPIPNITVLPADAKNKTLRVASWTGDNIWQNASYAPRIRQVGLNLFGIMFRIAAVPAGVGTATIVIESEDGGAQKVITVISKAP